MSDEGSCEKICEKYVSRSVGNDVFFFWCPLCLFMGRDSC